MHLITYPFPVSATFLQWKSCRHWFQKDVLQYVWEFPQAKMHIFQIIWRTFSRQKHPLTIFLKQKQNSYFHPEWERRLRIKFLIIVPNPILYNIEIKCVHSMNVTNIMNWLVNWNSQRQSGLLLTTIETII